MPDALADSPAVAVKLPRIAAGVEPRGGVVQAGGCDQPYGRNRVHEPRLKGKSHDIPKQLVWDAWLKVKENGGAAGVDGVTIEQFEEDLSGNLYRCGIGCRRGRISPGRSGQWRYPRRASRTG